MGRGWDGGMHGYESGFYAVKVHTALCMSLPNIRSLIDHRMFNYLQNSAQGFHVQLRLRIESNCK